MTPGRWLEVLGYYPARIPCLARRRFPPAQLSSAILEARQWFAQGLGDSERVQIQLVGLDRRAVLADWCASSWQRRRDEAGRRAKKHAW